MAAYDAIADTYDAGRQQSNTKDMFESLNVKTVLQPLVQDARVLELARASGF
jgi:Zn-dependent M32 family carboxypeptidase